MSILCALGILILAKYFSNNWIKFFTLSSLIIVIISFFAIMGPGANIDNNYFTPYSKFRASPIDSELAIQNMVNQYTGTIYTDFYLEPYDENDKDEWKKIETKLVS